MKKCIVFSRVSTELQQTEQQTEDLYTEAIRHGYKLEEIYHIEVKESAIKNDINHRISIQEMYDAINSNPIECVICREISRLSRRADVLYQVREFLITHKVQLIICKPYMELLDNECKITATANIMFAMFGAMAESEMEEKKIRFKQGKMLARKKGRFIGGHTIFGYTHTADCKIVPDDNAGIVKRIYNSYLLPENSVSSVAKELREEGVINHVNLWCDTLWVQRVLKNKKYMGDIQYPQIISEEIWNAVAAKRANGTFNNRTSDKSKSLLSKGIYRTEQGYKYTAACADGRYVSVMTKESIRIDFADNFSWSITVDFCVSHRNMNEEAKKRALRNVQMLHRKLHKLYSDKDNLEKGYERIEERYVLGRITKVKAESLRKSVDAELYNIGKQMRSIEDDIDKNNAIYGKKDDIDLENVSLADKINLIHSTIKYVVIQKLRRYNSIFHVYFTNGEQIDYECSTRTKTWKKVGN